jgi:uncharacterized protein
MRARLAKVSAAILIGLIRAYQWLLSPWLGTNCRHLPSCSSYAIEAIARFGPLAGGWLALKRIARCRPRGTSGYDPVPQALSPAKPREVKHS